APAPCVRAGHRVAIPCGLPRRGGSGRSAPGAAAPGVEELARTDRHDLSRWVPGELVLDDGVEHATSVLQDRPVASLAAIRHVGTGSDVDPDGMHPVADRRALGAAWHQTRPGPAVIRDEVPVGARDGHDHASGVTAEVVGDDAGERGSGGAPPLPVAPEAAGADVRTRWYVGTDTVGAVSLDRRSRRRDPCGGGA